MKIISWLLKAALFFAMFAFALNNLEPVSVRAFFGLSWEAPLVVVLLCAPVTWAMNVVWLLPLTVILLPASKPLRETAGRAGWIACVAGMALAGVPDSWVGSFQLRYVLALALSLAGLVALARRPLE